MLSHSRKLLLSRTAQQRLASVAKKQSVVTEQSYSQPLSTLSLTTNTSLSHFNQSNNFYSIRHLSSTSQDAKKDDSQQQQSEEKSKEEESLKDTVRRMGGKHNADKDDNMDPRVNEFLNKASSTWGVFSEEVGKAWDELLRSGERKDINKKLRHPEDTAEGEKEYTGPVEIMVIDESEHLTAWERMQKRLTEAPIIQDILSRTDDVFEKTGAKKSKTKNGSFSGRRKRSLGDESKSMGVSHKFCVRNINGRNT